MTEASTPPDPSTSLVLEYRLTEADIRRYCACGQAQAWWRLCWGQKGAMLVLAALGLFLVGLCYHAHGMRSGTLALGTSLAVLVALALSSQVLCVGRVCRLARGLGIPCDLRLTISPRGIAKEPGLDPSDPGRTFPWTEVVEVARLDGLTVVRLRPARGILLIPDRAFPSTEARENFAANAGDWRKHQ